MFLTLVYAEIERRWNKMPPFEIERPNPEKAHGGTAYKGRCLDVLKRLHAECCSREQIEETVTEAARQLRPSR